MRPTWTDERLDDLSDRVGDLPEEMHSLQRTIIQVGAALTAAMLGLIGVFVATQLRERRLGRAEAGRSVQPGREGGVDERRGTADSPTTPAAGVAS